MIATFFPSGERFVFQPGASLMTIAAQAGVSLDGNCGGKGVCGKCKVKVLSPDLGFRAACLYFPTTDVEVEIPATGKVTAEKGAAFDLPADFKTEPGITKVFLSPEPESETGAEPSGFAEQIKCRLGLPEPATFPLPMLQELPGLSRQDRGLSVTVAGGNILDIEAGDTTADRYGLAVDIGTTTVVGYLWRLSDGKLLGSQAVANPQWVYGADVISRIAFAAESRENMLEIQRLIVSCLSSLAAHLAGTANIDPRHIYGVSVVGNTTMNHLFLGVDPQSLALAPFTPVFRKPPGLSASDLGLAVNPRARVWLLPIIAGHVGSDITAGILATDILRSSGYHLLIDIGTNGEIVLCGGGRGIACSTAAGPAFEGATIYQGMRAAEGAVEKIILAENVEISVVGNTVPLGICGSGVIDGVAELVKAGIVKKSGMMAEAEKAPLLDLPQEIKRRLRDSGNEQRREFVVAYRSEAEDIVLTQRDIREAQMAKGAIAAGTQILLDRFGIGADDLTRVHLAGVFGKHIDVASALTIGLLPPVSKERIVSVGNAAGIGASLALLSETVREKARMVSEIVEHVELSLCDEFSSEYMKAMKF
ncbi:MAG: ASKHA domain-containing protein [Gracilibacteraceae bacterium]|jgi:uncharacterized 2Fe-2S/4Fe-4S cluster protein (DUF4445 family)|nr:ASKHA domain-containing protein [Gracilibacteraceae bacterium]